jgi:ATP-dependent exoDNAse (exonuclease V) alpha subunit
MNLTTHQEEIIQSVRGSLTDCCLIGRAGTGKSTCLRAIIEGIPDVILAAPTHTAAGKVWETTGKYCVTNASLLGKKQERDYNTGEVFFNPADFVETKRYYIVIDEAGMLTRKDYLKLKSNYPNARFLFVGDKGQLPPIGDEEFCIFDHLPCYELLVNMRCGQKNSLFDLIELVYETPADEISEIQFDFKDNVIEINQGMLTTDDLVLTYTRNTRKNYNTLIRGNSLISTETKFVADENICYDKQIGKFLLKNGKTFFPLKVEEKKIKIQGKDVLNRVLTLKSFKEFKVNYLEDRTVLDAYMKKLADQKLWKEYFKMKDLYPEVDLAYAMTTHKSQGQTFESPTVDLLDILKIGDPLLRKKCLYVALSRASESLKII